MLFAECVRTACVSGRPASAIFALPGRREAPLSHRFDPRPPPRRLFRALVPDADLPHAWPRIRAELRARSPTPRGTSGSSRCRRSGSTATRWSSRRRPRAAPGSRPASRACCGLHRRRARLRHAGAARRGRRAPPAPPSARDAGRSRGRRLQPALHVRPVRHRRRQPPRPRRRAGGRRAARARLQPAVHLRAARARQDPPAALDRQLRHRATATG